MGYTTFDILPIKTLCSDYPEASQLNEVGVQNAAGRMTLGQVSEVGAMPLMPFISRRVTVKSILLIGLLSWSVRYVLLAYGNAGAGMWMFCAAILLHGVCFDFFFMTGQLYTDQEAPADLRVTAQGFLTFVTYGLGMYVGSNLSGVAVDFFTATNGSVVTRNWGGFWLSSAVMSFALLLLVAVFFQGRARIQSKGAALAEAAD